MVNRVVMACLVLHNLLRIRYPTAPQEDFGGGGGGGQLTVVLKGNDIPYVGCNAIGAAKRQLIGAAKEEYSQGLFHE